MRRVVTGHDESGAAVVIVDGQPGNFRVREASGGLVSTLLWVTDATPADISRRVDAAEREIGVAPPTGGTVFRIVDFPPLKDAMALSQEAILKEMGVLDHDRGGQGARHPFTHRTKSIDYAVVMCGRIRMLLDYEEIVLETGDVLVQQGTNHAWINTFEEICRIAFVLVDAAVPPAWSNTVS